MKPWITLKFYMFMFQLQHLLTCITHASPTHYQPPKH